MVKQWQSMGLAEHGIGRAWDWQDNPRSACRCVCMCVCVRVPFLRAQLLCPHRVPTQCGRLPDGDREKHACLSHITATLLTERSRQPACF